MIKRILSSMKYQGKIKTVVLDFSGTTIDKYTLAPTQAFMDIFKRKGVEITFQEAREPMGLRKDLHIKKILENKNVRKRWIIKHGCKPNDNDADDLYNDFIPTQLENLDKYSKLLPETKNVIDHLQKIMKLKIGVTTGFTRPIVNKLLVDCKNQGFYPDAVVAGDDVQNGARPSPNMLYKVLDLVNSKEIQSVVKVGDGPSDVQEGKNAGCWSIGIARYSNDMNIDSFEHEKKLTSEEIQLRLNQVRDKLKNAGADYVINTLDELPGVIEDINKRLHSKNS